LQFDSEDPVEQSEKDETLKSAAENGMIYIKSTLVGIVTLFAGTIRLCRLRIHQSL
jgi:hypothetical protein